MRFLVSLAVLAAILAACPVRAGEMEQVVPSAPKVSQGNGPFNDTLTGDWGGLRGSAAAHGFSWEGSFKADAFESRGAARDGTSLISHLDVRLDMDLGKICGWSGASAVLDVLSDSGHGPAARNVDNLMGVTNIEIGAPTTTRLFGAWIQQSMLSERLSLLVGLYPIDSEFFAVDSAGVFLAPEYGAPADLALTRGPSIFNASSFGVRARWNFGKTGYAMAAVVDGIPDDPAHPKRTAIRFAEGDGSFHIAEVGWTPEAGNANFSGFAKAALGLWGYTANTPDLADPSRHHRQHGGYVFAEHTLWRFGENRQLSGFARFTWADGNSIAIENSVNLGIQIKGPLRARPNDILGLAMTRAGTSSAWRQSMSPQDTTSSEQDLELSYRYALTPAIGIQPDVQFIRNPGGLSGVPSAKLIGVRLDVAL